MVSQGVLTGVILLPFIVGIIILFRRSQTRIPLLVYPDSTKVLSQSSINDADLAGGIYYEPMESWSIERHFVVCPMLRMSVWDSVNCKVISSS